MLASTAAIFPSLMATSRRVLICFWDRLHGRLSGQGHILEREADSTQKQQDHSHRLILLYATVLGFRYSRTCDQRLKVIAEDRLRNDCVTFGGRMNAIPLHQSGWARSCARISSMRKRDQLQLVFLCQIFVRRFENREHNPGRSSAAESFPASSYRCAALLDSPRMIFSRFDLVEATGAPQQQVTSAKVQIQRCGLQMTTHSPDGPTSGRRVSAHPEIDHVILIAILVEFFCNWSRDQSEFCFLRASERLSRSATITGRVSRLPIVA